VHEYSGAGGISKFVCYCYWRECQLPLFVHRREKFDAASAQVRAQDGKRFDSCGSEPSALPAVASCLQDKPSAAESGGAGAAAPTCDAKFQKLGHTALTTRESASARRLAGRQRTAAAAQPFVKRGFGSSTFKCTCEH
jgi:hypothetical protein